MIRDYKSLIKKIEKNNKSILDNHLKDVGTQRYWKRYSNHEVLSRELETVKNEIKFMFKYCNIIEMIDQHRYNFIEEDIIKLVKGE